jgi:hypothetical protein
MRCSRTGVAAGGGPGGHWRKERGLSDGWISPHTLNYLPSNGQGSKTPPAAPPGLACLSYLFQGSPYLNSESCIKNEKL